MNRIGIDNMTRCSCGHRMEQHKKWEPPAPCRMRECECEGFYLVKGDGAIVTVPVK